MTSRNNKNELCAVLWLDAAYFLEKKYPNEYPRPQVTTGFIMEANEDYINVATNVSYNRKKESIWPVDGFVIPKGAILKFKKLASFNEKPKFEEE